MKKVLLLLAACTVCFSHAYAQLSKADDIKKGLETENKDTAAWIYSGVLDAGCNEGFLHNWSAGGELVSATFNGILNGNLTRLNKRTVWSTDLNLAYGLYYAYSNDFVPRKTDDRIDFTTKYGIRIDTTKNFYVTGLFDFKSQFTKGYDYTRTNFDSTSTSRFLSPAYFTLGIGAEYRKGTDLSLFLSPVSARITTASRYYTLMDPAGAFGVPYGKTSQFDFGAYFSGMYTINISKRMVYKTRLDLYSNYLAADKKDSVGNIVKKDNPGNIDVLFDNLFTYKVSKYLSFTIGATFIYDNDIPYVRTKTDPATGATVDKGEPGEGLGWLQLKQVFAMAFEYKIN